MDTSLNALLNMSFNKIDSMTSKNNNLPPSLSNHPRFLYSDKRNNNGGSIMLNDNQVPMPSFVHNTISDKNDNTTRNYITLQEQNMHLEDIDFWLIFDNKDVIENVKNLMEMLKNQLESINILKVKQAYYLERETEGVTKVTGWKLFDKSVAGEVIKRTKELMLNFNNKRIKYEVIASTQELRKHLRKYELDKRLNEVDLFQGEYALPLFKLQIQGLFYYEFDYVDICPETVYAVCGLPPYMTNAQIKGHIKDNGLPEPLNILRNPLEGDSCARLSFASRNDAELFRLKGLKIPILGPFKEKPLIIMAIKDRSFDYFALLNKYQVMVDFEANEDQDLQSKVEVLRALQTSYGIVSDVNILYSQLWIVTFMQFDSATKCLDRSKLDHFSLQITISKPFTSYILTGYLFQPDTSMIRNTNIPARPPPLLRVDPTHLKIKTEYFNLEKNLNLKRRYQKVYLRQHEAIIAENNQVIADFFSNDVQPLKEKLELLVGGSKNLEARPPWSLPSQEEQKAPETTMKVEDNAQTLPALDVSSVYTASQTQKKNRRKPQRTKKTKVTQLRKNLDQKESLLKKRRLSPVHMNESSEDITVTKKAAYKTLESNVEHSTQLVTVPRTIDYSEKPVRARKSGSRNFDESEVRIGGGYEEDKMKVEQDDEGLEKGQERKVEKMVKEEEINQRENKVVVPKIEEEAPVMKVKRKQESSVDQEQNLIQRNIEKIKQLIVSHKNLRRRKSIKESSGVKREEVGKKGTRTTKSKSKEPSKAPSKPRSSSRKQK